MPQEITFHYFDHPISQEDADSLDIFGLTELVMEAYGLSGDEDFAREQFENEFEDDETNKVFIATRQDRAIAAIVFNPVLTFGTEMKVFGVRGVTCLNEARGLGLGKKLYADGVKILGIDVITGSTKTPEAVLSRASGTRSEGMRTFFGDFEVTTKELSGRTSVHHQILNDFLANKHKCTESYNNYSLQSTSVDLLLPNIPRIEEYPLYIQEAFSDVISYQRKLGTRSTAVQTLFSVKESFLKERFNV